MVDTLGEEDTERGTAGGTWGRNEVEEEISFSRKLATLAAHSRHFTRFSAAERRDETEMHLLLAGVQRKTKTKAGSLRSQGLFHRRHAQKQMLNKKRSRQCIYLLKKRNTARRLHNFLQVSFLKRAGVPRSRAKDRNYIRASPFSLMN